MTVTQYNWSPVMTPVRVVQVTNLAGVYFNGQTNNGVGATLTKATAGALTIDSILVVANDRVLLKNQDNTNENGIYIVVEAGDAGTPWQLQRSADQQSIEQLRLGQYVTVYDGGVNAGSAFVLATALPAHLGVDELTWTASPLNSVLGTAAAKEASDNAMDVVASVAATVAANRFAIFTDTNGTLDDTTANAIHEGNIQAGLSGTAGTLISYPATLTTGSLIVAGVANGGNFNVTLSNASHGQATVYSIPDVGAATGQILNKTAAFTSGNLIAASGTAGKTVDAGAPTTGLLQVASVAVTAAEFNGMYAAPKLLIAAPGANNLIEIDRMLLIMTYVSANYANGGIVAAQYDSTANGAGVKATNTEAAADFFAAASTTFSFVGTSGNTAGIIPFSTSVNKGIYLSNQSGAFTTGDSTFVVKIYYRIVATV